MTHSDEFDTTFSHPAEYPKECVDKLLELIATRKLRDQWQVALPCLLTVAAYLVTKILNSDPDGPIAFGNSINVPAGLLALHEQLGGSETLLTQANQSVAVSGSAIGRLILRRIVAEVIEMLKAITADDILNWIDSL